MKKKVISLLMAAMMTVCAAGAFGGNAGTVCAEEIEEITYAFTTFTSVPADVQSVEDELNKITEPEIGVHVNLLILPVSSYSQQIALMVSSGEALDVFHTLGDIGQYVSKNQIQPLDDLIEQYGQDILEIEPEFFRSAGVINGQTYGIPFWMGKALAPTCMYRQDILDELGIDGKDIHSYDDLEAVLEKVKEAHPEMNMVAPLNSGDCGLQLEFDHVDYLSDNSTTPIGVLVGDSTEVVNYFAQDGFKQVCERAHDWYEKGYLEADAATTTNLASSQVASGTAFAMIGAYSGEIPEIQFAVPEGASLGSARLGDPMITTADVNTLSRVISVGSQHAEAAMKFINLTYTNPDVSQLLTYGIEGRDYVLTDDGYITYPEGQNMMTVPYNCYLSAATSNQFMEGGRLMIGNSQEDIDLQKEENTTAWKSKAFGFTFDSSSVKAQYSAVNNVINQYKPGLVCGSLDPETELPKFISALEAAGINDIIAAKQEQLDAWLAEQ